jgi:hypothetical protein
MQSNNREKIKEINKQKQLHERFKELQSNDAAESNPIVDIIQSTSLNMPQNTATINEKTENSNLSSLQDRFGVKKINRPIKDSQLTARIDSKTLTRFKDIVKKMYYPDKPNINETVTQIIRAFVDEYDRNSTNEIEQNLGDTHNDLF